MLKVLRDNLKYLSWVLWGVIAVFILFVFVDFGGTVNRSGAAKNSAAVEVGKEEISFGEFERAYRQAENTYRQAYGDEFTSELARQIGLPRQVIESLIGDKLLMLEAERMGLEITDSELRREILRLPVFQTASGGFVGEAAYKSTLRANGLTPEDFEDDVRRSLLTDRVRSVLADSIYVSDQEVEESYREKAETAKIRYVHLTADPLAGPATPDSAGVDPAAIEAYYNEHAGDFQIPERRTVDYLLVDRAALQASMEIADSEIETYYQEHPDEFRRDEQVHARHILLQVNDQRTADQAVNELTAVRRRIEGGEDFAAVAEEVSEDPGSGPRGGDLGFFGRGQMVPQFEEAAFGGQPGELVGPITTSFGAHLIEVLERRPGGVEPLDDVREQIRVRLLGERTRSAAESKAQALEERIRKEKIHDSAAMAALAEGDAGVQYQTSVAFGEADHVEGIGRSTAFTVAAYDLGEGEVSEPVKIARGWAILRVASIDAPRQAELDEVRDDVTAALARQQAKQRVMARLEEARGALAGGDSLDDVASRLGADVEESSSLTRGASVAGLDHSAAIVAEALSLDDGAFGGPISTDDGAVLFEVVERGRFDPTAFAGERETTRSRIEAQRVNELMGELLAARRSTLNIRYAPELVENFKLDASTTGT
jgi:peptidyl-prolyl cis-trans isomerase D